MEGSAVMCESLCRKPSFTPEKNIALTARLKTCFSQVRAWLECQSSPISADDWDKYYALWGEDKLVYLLGKFAFKKLLEHGISVSDAIRMPPMDWFEKVMVCV